MNATRESLKFRWANPVPGDRFNVSTFGDGVCVAAAVILDNQVIARVYEHVVLDDLTERKHSARLFEEGSSTLIVPPCMWPVAMVKTHVEQHLFGVVNDMMLCVSCGKLANVSHSSAEKRMREVKLCHTCLFFTDLHRERLSEPDRFAVVDGKLYSIGVDDPSIPSDSRGFGGRRFNIRWNDGRLAMTTNLWHRGEIPAHLRKYFPDDAVFGGEEGPR